MNKKRMMKQNNYYYDIIKQTNKKCSKIDMNPVSWT